MSPRHSSGARGQLHNPGPQYTSAPNPITTGNDRAIADAAFRQKFANLQNRATDRMRGSPTSAAPTVEPSSLALSPPHDWSGFDKSFPRGVQPATQLPSPTARLDVNSPAVQSALDAAAGIKPTTPTNTATAYGTGGVRFDKSASGPSHPITDANGKQIGVGRDFDVNAARQNLYAKHPEIFHPEMDGGVANKAFVDHVKQFGEQSAHENLAQVLGPSQALADVPEGAPVSGTQGKQLAQMARSQAGQQAESTIKPSLPDRAVNAGANLVQNSQQNAQPMIDAATGKVDTSPTGPSATAANALRSTGNAIAGGWDSLKNGVANLISPTPSTAPLTDADTNKAYLNNAVRKSQADNATAASTPDRSTLSMPDEVPNYALGYSPTGNDMAGEEAWRNDMRAGMQAQKNDNASAAAEEKGNLIAAGFPNTPVTTPQQDTQVLNGANGRQSMLPGAGNSAWNVPNYAGGVHAAMMREKSAIKQGVGGARPGDQPVAVNLPGVGTSVINTGEKVIPNMAGGVAVVNRKMLQHGVPNYAGGVHIKPSHRGRLHRALNVPLDQKIPASRIASAKNSPSPALRKQATFAQNFAH